MPSLSRHAVDAFDMDLKTACFSVDLRCSYPQGHYLHRLFQSIDFTRRRRQRLGIARRRRIVDGVLSIRKSEPVSD